MDLHNEKHTFIQVKNIDTKITILMCKNLKIQ